MADGGYIFDEDLDQNFLEWEKFSYFCTMGEDDTAFALTTKAFRISDDELKQIIDKYKDKDDTDSN